VIFRTEKPISLLLVELFRVIVKSLKPQSSGIGINIFEPIVERTLILKIGKSMKAQNAEIIINLVNLNQMTCDTKQIVQYLGIRKDLGTIGYSSK